MLDPIRGAIHMRSRDVRMLQEIVLPESVISNQRRGFERSTLAQSPDPGFDLDHLTGTPAATKRDGDLRDRPDPQGLQ